MDLNKSKYWYIADSKIKDCKHEKIEKKLQGIVLLNYCPNCKLLFWPKEKSNE